MPSIATLSANNKILLEQVSALKNHLYLLTKSNKFNIEKEMANCLAEFNKHNWVPRNKEALPLFDKLHLLLSSGRGTSADLLLFTSVIEVSVDHPLAVWLCATENLISDEI